MASLQSKKLLSRECIDSGFHKINLCVSCSTHFTLHGKLDGWQQNIVETKKTKGKTAYRQNNFPAEDLKPEHVKSRWSKTPLWLVSYLKTMLIESIILCVHKLYRSFLFLLQISNVPQYIELIPAVYLLWWILFPCCKHEVLHCIWVTSLKFHANTLCEFIQKKHNKQWRYSRTKISSTRAFKWCITHVNSMCERRAISNQNFCYAWVILMTTHFLYPMFRFLQQLNNYC